VGFFSWILAGLATSWEPSLGGIKQTMQMYGNFEGFPEKKMVHFVWVGVLFFDLCTSGPVSPRIFHENAGK